MLSHRPVAAFAAALSLAAGTAFGGHGLYLRAKAVAAELLLERAWYQTVARGQPVKAWPWADTWPVARLRFPRLGRSAIVLAAGGGEALAFGPAHVAGTPLPGEGGTSVVAGHRDTHFRFIRELVAGDEIEVTSARGIATRFRVTGFAVVDPRASGIDAETGVPRLALVTCWPFDGLQRGTRRYVVFAERAD